MPVPAIASVLTAIGWPVKGLGKWLAWRLVKWGLWMAASVWAGKYKPEVHAKKSRRWEWNKFILPAINKTKTTPNKFDDSGAAFAYYHQCGYIEDGTLPELIRRAGVAIRRPAGDGIAEALDLLGQASRLIETPDNDGDV